MKILALNPNISVDELSTLLKNEGISERRLTGALSASFLPPIGQFQSFGIDGEPEKEGENGKKINSTKHVRIGTKDMLDSISLSRLQINLHMGNPTNDDLKQTTEGNYYLPGNTVVNPHLQGNQALILKKMLNKHFVASEMVGVGTNYIQDGIKNIDDVKFRPVKAYKVTLFDSKEKAEDYLKSLQSAKTETTAE